MPSCRNVVVYIVNEKTFLKINLAIFLLFTNLLRTNLLLIYTYICMVSKKDKRHSF